MLYQVISRLFLLSQVRRCYLWLCQGSQVKWG